MSTRVGPANGLPSPVNSPKLANGAPTATSTAKTETDTKPMRSRQQRKDAKVRLQYLKNDPLYDTVPPLQITPNFADRERKTNVQLDEGPLETMQDVRGREEDFSLDGNGFRYVRSPTNFKDWDSQPEIARLYLPELEELLKREVSGCDEVMFYDARIRQASEGGARVQGLSYNPFAKQVHTDNTERSVHEKLHNLVDMKALYYLKGRVRLINIWRPIKHPVYDCGLAIADGGKLQRNDVVVCERRRAQEPDRYWDTMGVIKYRPGFDWYYMYLQDEPDVLLFKNYDSAEDVPARCCLHTAFDLPPEDVPADAPTRESIEVRAFVFTHPQGSRKPSEVAVQHPLALTLEQNSLKLVDDEHSITDRLRTDIDEGNEMKDAMLLLRRQEIRRLEGVRSSLVAKQSQLQEELKQSRSEKESLQHELDQSSAWCKQTRMQLEQAHEQIGIQTRHVEALQLKVQRLEGQLSQDHGDLHLQTHLLSKELTDARMFEQTKARTEADGIQASGVHLPTTQDPEMALLQARANAQEQEIILLNEHIERHKYEVQRWKLEAEGVGNEAVSRSWQASVDEAVRRERKKDVFVMQALREEIERLKGDGKMVA